MHQAIDLQDFVNELSFRPLIHIALGGGGGQDEKKNDSVHVISRNSSGIEQ